MPTGIRRRGQSQPDQYLEPALDADAAEDETEVDVDEELQEEMMEDEEEEEEEEEDAAEAETEAEAEAEDGEDEEEEVEGIEDVEVVDEVRPAITNPPPLPPDFKDISSLASWAVSSAKPGCAVAQLRAPSLSLYWQSDGPQPHHLDIHFFKLVEIVGIRLYLDFDLDESYTPTKIAFLAGTGYNDLQEWSVMSFEQPRGWVDVDFSGVGAMDGESEAEEEGVEEEEEEEEEEVDVEVFGEGARKKWPVLRAMLVRVQIMENHQNGKDTHLRKLQIFAREKGGTGAGAPLKRASRVVPTMGSEGKKVRNRLPEPQWDSVPGLR